MLKYWVCQGDINYRCRRKIFGMSKIPPPHILYQIKYRGRNEMYPGNGTEGAIGCTDVGRQQRPQFHFLRVSFIPSPGMKCVQTLSCARVHPTLSIFYEIGCPMDVIERTFYNRYGLQTLLNWVQFVSCSQIFTEPMKVDVRRAIHIAPPPDAG